MPFRQLKWAHFLLVFAALSLCFHLATGDPTEEILTATFDELFSDQESSQEGTPAYVSPDFYVTVNISCKTFSCKNV